MGSPPLIKAWKIQSRASKLFLLKYGRGYREFWSIPGCSVFRYITARRSRTVDKFHLMWLCFTPPIYCQRMHPSWERVPWEESKKPGRQRPLFHQHNSLMTRLHALAYYLRKSPGVWIQPEWCLFHVYLNK